MMTSQIEIDNVIDNLLLNIEKQDYKIFYEKIFDAISKFIKQQNLILTGTRALYLHLFNSFPDSLVDPWICYTMKGLANTGQLIKLFRTMGFAEIKTSSFTLSNIDGAELVECEIKIGMANMLVKVIELITVPLNQFNKITKIKINGFNVVSKEIARMIVYNKLSNFLLNINDIPQWMKFKIQLEQKYFNSNEITNKQNKEIKDKQIKDKDNTSIHNLNMNLNDDNQRLFINLMKLNGVVFVGNFASSILQWFANNKIIVDLVNPVMIATPDAKLIVNKIKNNNKNISYKYFNSFVGLIPSYYVINKLIDSGSESKGKYKIIAIVFNTQGSCVPYRSITVNGSKENAKNKYNVQIDQLKIKDSKIKIGDLYTIIRFYLFIDYLKVGNNTNKNNIINKKIEDLNEARFNYLTNRKLIGVESTPFSVLNFKCYSFNEKTLYLNDSVRPKILLWNVKKEKPEEYEKVKRECKAIK